jgi:hypothetical protein
VYRSDKVSNRYPLATEQKGNPRIGSGTPGANSLYTSTFKYLAPTPSLARTLPHLLGTTVPVLTREPLLVQYKNATSHNHVS